ncbi:ATP-dependent DNA helicase PIF1-like protein [Tanacetum coccineum]
MSKKKFMRLLDACNNNTEGMFFVYGYGGTGKTFLYKTLTAALSSKGQIVLNVASSGIASLLLDGGRTAHSRFAMCSISADSDLAELIRETKTLRDLCFVNSSQSLDIVFGGKVVVFGGDFRQILLVIPNSIRQEVVHASLNMSYLWKHCIVLKLTQNMRLHVGCNPNDAEEINEFAEWILNIGEGKAGGKNDGHAEVEFPEEMLIPNLDDHVESVIKETYDNWEEKLEKVCYSSDSMSDVDIDFNYNESMYTTEFLNTIRMSGIPNHKLVLKIGAPVMCLQNIDQKGGLCNGEYCVDKKDVRKSG